MYNIHIKVTTKKTSNEKTVLATGTMSERCAKLNSGVANTASFIARISPHGDCREELVYGLRKLVKSMYIRVSYNILYTKIEHKRHKTSVNIYSDNVDNLCRNTEMLYNFITHRDVNDPSINVKVKDSLCSVYTFNKHIPSPVVLSLLLYVVKYRTKDLCRTSQKKMVDVTRGSVSKDPVTGMVKLINSELRKKLFRKRMKFFLYLFDDFKCDYYEFSTRTGPGQLHNMGSIGGLIAHGTDYLYAKQEFDENDLSYFNGVISYTSKNLSLERALDFARVLYQIEDEYLKPTGRAFTRTNIFRLGNFDKNFLNS